MSREGFADYIVTKVIVATRDDHFGNKTSFFVIPGLTRYRILH